MFTLADLMEGYQGVRPEGATLGISEAVVDSRAAIPASLFVAIKAGHDFVVDAFKHGASFALIQRDIDPAIPVVDLTSPLPTGFCIPEPPFALKVANTEKALQKISAFWRGKFNVRVIGITGSVGKSTTKELVSEVLGVK
jgi:UDP-N-acetylmuramoyl-tripeptide--D-alanyl-D-alanine ligase